MDLHCLKLQWSYLICQVLAKFSGLNPKGLYLGGENEKETFCVVLTYSILVGMWNEEVSCHSHATTARKCTKKRDAHAKLFAIAIAKTPYCCHSGLSCSKHG